MGHYREGFAGDLGHLVSIKRVKQNEKGFVLQEQVLEAVLCDAFLEGDEFLLEIDCCGEITLESCGELMTLYHGTDAHEVIVRRKIDSEAFYESIYISSLCCEKGA